MSPDDVTRVEVGGGRRRWWPVVLAGAAAWAVIAAVVGSGGGDDPTAVASTTTSAPAPASATTAPTPADGPLLGRETGWHAVAGGRVLDLDSGVSASFGGGEIVAARPDGLVTRRGTGFYRWQPFPFRDDTAVTLAVGRGQVFPLRERPLAWIGNEGEPRTDIAARLVSLEDGRVVAETSVGPLSSMVGVAGEVLVVDGGGDTFVVGPDGSARRLADGTPVAVGGDRVVVTSCDEALRCSARSIDVVTGESTELPGLARLPWFPTGPASPDGWLPVVVPNGGAVVLGPDGTLLGLPDDVDPDRLGASTWTPDGRLLVVPGSATLVVDPFGPDGARVVATLELTGSGGPIAVVGPAV